MTTKFAFLGSSEFSIQVLTELKNLNHLPSLIVTLSGQPQGRGLIVQDNPVKIWAEKNKIPFLIPTKFNSEETIKALSNFKTALVASLGKIISAEVLKASECGLLNIHPSLLPKYRGPSPIVTQILSDEKEIGVSIMKIDSQIDHGQIVIQEKTTVPNWPVTESELSEFLAKKGATLFVKILDDYVAGKVKLREQNHQNATLTRKYEKSDSMIDLTADPYQNYLKYCAFKNSLRVRFLEPKINTGPIIVTDADFQNNAFIIKKVLPPGKKEMSYADFLRGLK